MATPTCSTDSGFPEALLRGLVALGPVNLRRDNLTIELGLSLWMRQCGIAVGDANDVILALRNILIEVAGFDRTADIVLPTLEVPGHARIDGCANVGLQAPG